VRLAHFSNLTRNRFGLVTKNHSYKQGERYETRIALCEKARDPDGARCAAAFAAPQAMAQVASPDFGSGKGLTLSVDFPARYWFQECQWRNRSPGAPGAASDVRRRMTVDSSSSSVYIKGSEKLGAAFCRLGLRDHLATR